MVAMGKLMEDRVDVPFDMDFSRQQGEGGAPLATFPRSLDPIVSLASGEGERGSAFTGC